MESKQNNRLNFDPLNLMAKLPVSLAFDKINLQG